MIKKSSLASAGAIMSLTQDLLKAPREDGSTRKMVHFTFSYREGHKAHGTATQNAAMVSGVSDDALRPGEY